MIGSDGAKGSIKLIKGDLIQRAKITVSLYLSVRVSVSTVVVGVVISGDVSVM